MFNIIFMGGGAVMRVGFPSSWLGAMLKKKKSYFYYLVILSLLLDFEEKLLCDLVSKCSSFSVGSVLVTPSNS